MRAISLAVTLAFLAASSASLANAAEDGPEPVSIRVSTRDVDFKDPKSVAAFDERLRRAAVAACDSGQPRMLKFVLEDDQCARKAWKDAVRSIDQPILNAMHGQVTMLAQNK